MLDRARTDQARPDRARSHPRHHSRRRARDRGGGRAHGALADDPRPARLSRGAVRRQGTQAHRPLLFGDRRAGLRIFRRRRHSSRRRLLLERSLQFLRRHRPRARPLHHGADLLRRPSDRLQPGIRPSRRRRRLGARKPARPCHRQLDGGRARSRRSSSTTAASSTRPPSASSCAIRACPSISPAIWTPRSAPPGSAAGGSSRWPSATASTRSKPPSSRSSRTPPRSSGAKSCRRSRTAFITSRTMSRPTASTSRACTRCASR